MPCRQSEPPTPTMSLRAGLLVAVAGTVFCVALVVGLDRAGAAPVAALRAETSPTAQAAAQQELTIPKAIVLGLVEGVTEFLPISSTGHLLVAERLMDVGAQEQTKDAADTYTVAIQAGAILAVLVLYWRRLWSMVEGALGRDEAGRRVLVAVLVAAVPIALVGLVFEKKIKERLLEPFPVVIAWLVGGILLIVFARRWDERHQGNGLEAITVRQAAVVGAAQVLALWPGTSRALVTIVAALAVGLTLSAAVEFSFVLGFVTLGGATAYELLRHGNELFKTYGVVSPLIGVAVAFVSAALAITWMVRYLQRHSVAIFGYYRIAIAVAVAVLIAAGALRG